MDWREVIDRNHLLGYALTAITLTALVTISTQSVVKSIAVSQTGPLFTIILALVFLIRAFVALPLSILIVYVGFIYGFPEGLLFGLLGASISCLPPFIVARTIRTDTGFIGLISRPSTKFFDSGDSARGIVAARLLPVPTDVISYSAGLANVSVSSFIVGTVIGLFPWVLPEILIGDSMQVFSTEGAVLTSELLVGLSILGILLLYQFLSQTKLSE